MLALGWVDWTLLACLGLSILIGLWRGLVFELMALAGWLVAYVLAQTWSPAVAPHLSVAAAGSALQLGAAFLLTFVAVLIGWTLLARLTRMLVHATPLTVPDRLLGAGFGFLRGTVLLLALATLVAYTPAARSQAWRESQGAAWLDQALHGIKPVLPQAMQRHMP